MTKFYRDADTADTGSIDCSDPENASKPECQEQQDGEVAEKDDSNGKGGSTIFLIIFGGSIILILVIYLILELFRYIRQKKQGNQEQN